MALPLAKLEEWMRRYYHAVDHDIGSSGVRDLTVGELGDLADFDLADLKALVFHDSEPLGGWSLRAALADRWTRGDPERVMVTHGSSEAIWLVMQTLVHPGDDVVVVDPAYQQLYDIAVGQGARLRRWDLSSGDGFRVDLARLRRLVADQRPRLIVVNFPHNPTGVTITRRQQDELIQIASTAGSWLVWDNAFGEITYGADSLPLPHDRYERTVSFGTFSKSYGLAGIRTGWCLAPPELLLEMAYLRDYVALYVSPVLEFFAERAVRHADRIVGIQRDHARRNREVLLEWARARPDRVRLTPPAGGVSALVEVLGGRDVTDLCRRLAEEYRTLLVPGECFGAAYRSHVRLGFGGTRAELTAGLANLDRLL